MVIRAADVYGALTIVRAQEGTDASNKNTGGKTPTMILGITANMITTDLFTKRVVSSCGITSTIIFNVCHTLQY
jgi:hypothetical protein